MDNGNYLTFINNDIKGIQNNLKRLSVVEYFKNKLGDNGILFFYKKHIPHFNDENIWKNDFNVPIFYSHDTSQYPVVSLLHILKISTFQLTNK